MKKLLTMIYVFVPSVVFGQGVQVVDPDDGIFYASLFTGNFSFLLSILIGVFATYFVFRSAKKMGGGLFGKVLNYMALGMILVIMGAFSLVAPMLTEVKWISIVHGAFLSLGFVFLAVGAEKLLRGITEK